MLDILLALKWVKQNIKYFGGNPNKITVAGQSSGGAMASSLLVSPLVPPNLFQQMIIHSGTIFAPWSWSLDPISNAKDIAGRANVTKNATIHEINDAFMKMNVFDLMKATDEHYVIDIFIFVSFKIRISILFQFIECWYCPRCEYRWWPFAYCWRTIELFATQTKRSVSNGFL